MQIIWIYDSAANVHKMKPKPFCTHWNPRTKHTNVMEMGDFKWCARIVCIYFPIRNPIFYAAKKAKKIKQKEWKANK